MLTQNVLVGPKGHFLLGNLPEFQKDELAFLTRCSQEYSEIVPLRLLHMSIYLLLNPDHIEQVLSTHSRDFVKSRMYKLAESLIGNGLVMSEGDFWLRQRRLMQPAFHKERIAAYGQIMVDYAERILSTWQDGQILDVNRAMMRLSMEITTKTLFNCDVNDDPEGIGEAVRIAIKEVAARFSNTIPLPESIPTPGNLRYSRAIRRLNEVVYSLISKRRAKPEDTGDLLSMLLLAQDEDGSQMTDQQLRDQTMTLFLGGFENTGVTLSWSWYLLSQHPEVEAKLLAELESVLGGHLPTVMDLPKLHYTEMIIMEALRLYPSLPLLGREATKDFEMGGHHFPAGTELWIVPWVIHRSSRYYEAPDEFRPERWEGDLAKRLPKFAYFPFSGGPRVCIGNTFALMEAKLVLATMAQRFQLRLAPEQDVAPKFSGTLRPKEPLKMVLTERHPGSQPAHPAALPSALPVEP